MFSIGCILAFPIIWAILAFYYSPLWVFTLATFLLLFVITKAACLPIFLIVLFWFLFIAPAILLNIPVLRRKFITGKIFPLFKKMMPALSATEKEALDAGTVWWDGDLFSGNPDWSKLLNFPDSKLSEKEKNFLDREVSELCQMLDDWKITNELNDLPPEVWKFLSDKGFFGLIIPTKYGGLEFSTLAQSMVVMKIASRSITAAVTVMVPNSLGPGELLLEYGTEEQKNYYLPRLAIGKEIPCFGLTGPEAGSDAGSVPDIGVVCIGEFNGDKDVLGVRLNWEKRYITLGPMATVLGLAFKLVDPDHLLGSKEKIGITIALIPTNTKGVKIGTRHAPLNSVFQVGPNWGKDVFIPMNYLIGGAACRGKGWRMLMECLSKGRSISLPALSAGSSKLAARLTGAYGRIRKQFNLPIGRFEGVEEALARIGGYTYLIDAARVMTTGGLDQGEKPSVLSAIIKYNSTELTRKVINDAMDILGGAAICMGPRNLLARMYQSIPISITVEGANILTRSMIIFGQGAIRCHPYIVKEMLAAGEEDEEKGVLEFDKAIFSHVGFVISNGIRSFLLGLTAKIIFNVPGSAPEKYYYRNLTRISSAFAFTSDLFLLLLGASLKRKEKISGRFADILSYLYLASSALKRFHREGAKEEDLPLLDWACKTSLYLMEDRLDGLMKNIPLPPYISFFIKRIIFPVGRLYEPPSDKLDHKVATLLLTPSQTRDRLTDGIFLPENIKERMGFIEDTLKKVILAEEPLKKISGAIKDGVVSKGREEERVSEAMEKKIITENEADLINLAIEARREVIKVDDF